jgi:hypothetical protein
LEQREKARRGRLLSTIGFGFLLVMLIGLPIGFTDPATLTVIVSGLVATTVVLLLNRAGLVTPAGVLFVMIVEAVFISAIITAPDGQLDVVYVPLYSLLTFGILIGVSVLAPYMAFVVAAANAAFVIADVNLQPATPALNAVLDTTDRYTVIAQPIGLYIITAFVSFLWVRSTLAEIRRADRAEEIAALEHTLADQKRQLDVGIQQILQTHVRAANGDFNARAPLAQDNLLWQIASSLNNLLSRLQRTGQDTFQLRRTNQEAQRLADAIDVAQGGRKPVWPAPSGTAIDLILERIRGGRRGAPSVAPPQSQPAPPDLYAPSSQAQPENGYAPGGSPNWAQRAPSGRPPDMEPPGGWPQGDNGWPAPPESASPTGADASAQETNPWTFPQDES